MVGEMDAMVTWLLGSEENTVPGEMTVHCSGEVLVCLCLKIELALSCLHMICPEWGLIMRTEVLGLLLHRAKMTL